MPQILVPKLSLFGLPLKTAVEQIKEAGFDGIEVIITNRFKNYIWRCQHFAKELGLTLHFHQAWSLQESPSHFFNYPLSWLGYLPKAGYLLADHVPPEIKNPVVVSVDRWAEAEGHPNYWVQTDCVMGRDGCYKMSYWDFLTAFLKHQFPIVFDTQHFLEYFKGNKQGVESLANTSPAMLLNFLITGWKTFGKSVKEIHLCDFDPSLGHEKGRNVFPGNGILPLKEFLNEVRQSGWQGFITPEVAPYYLLPYRVSRLKELKKKVEELWN